MGTESEEEGKVLVGQSRGVSVISGWRFLARNLRLRAVGAHVAGASACGGIFASGAGELGRAARNDGNALGGCLEYSWVLKFKLWVNR